MTNESEAAYERIQEQVARGWNTWDTRSVLTQVLLPEALRGGERATLGTYPFTAGLTRTVELADTPTVTSSPTPSASSAAENASGPAAT